MDDQKRQALINDLKKNIVNTLDGRKTLFDLCENIGIKNRVRYYNLIEKKAPKSVRTMTNQFVTINKTLDFGFIFNDGFEIQHVDSAIYKLYDAPVIEKRIRK